MYRLFILLWICLLGMASAQAADCPQPGGRVLIKTQPGKAEVWLNGQKLADETPLVTSALCPGKYTVEVKADGHESRSLSLEVMADTLKTQTIALKAIVPPDLIRESVIEMDLVRIRAGCFQMGSLATEQDHHDSQGPRHQVCIEQDYYLGKTEVTQAQWQAVMGNNPSNFKGGNLPVEKVSWDDVQEFIRKLNARSGGGYRLPSEAEWEYAARAGTTSAYSFGDASSKLGAYAWYVGNSGKQSHPVAEKLPNPWGLHDMHGNVFELVADCWHVDYNGIPTDGSAQVTGQECLGVARGGSWDDTSALIRSAHRSIASHERTSFFGLRLARTPTP